MALIPFADKRMQSSITTTTGPYQLTTNVGAFKTWRSYFADGSEVFYFAEDTDASNWEVGYGVLAYGSPDTITRTAVLESSTGSAIDWSGVTVYVFSVPVGRANPGRYVTTKTMWVPENRQPTTAVGAANKTIAAADVAGRFTLDNSGAARSVNLPTLASVGEGFFFEFIGTSQANAINLVPNGSEVVDYGSGGVTLPMPGKVLHKVWHDGSKWQTNFNYGAMHILGVVTPNGASSVDFTGFPYWMNRLELAGSLKAVTNNVAVCMQTYGADGVLDSGVSDYWYQGNLTDNGGGTSVLSSGGATSSLVIGGNVSNGGSVVPTFHVRSEDIRAARYTQFNFHTSYLNQAGLVAVNAVGAGGRSENDLITGVRLFFGSGNAGNGIDRVTLLGGA